MSDPVRALYDTVATAYDAAFANELDGRPLDRALLAGLVDSIGEGPVADLGCGPGQVAVHLHRCGVEQVVGVDIVGVASEAGLIEVARCVRAPSRRRSTRAAAATCSPPAPHSAGLGATYLTCSVGDRAALSLLVSNVTLA